MQLFFVISKLEEQIKQDLGLNSLQEILDKKDEHRPYLYHLIRDYNSPDKAKLSKEILKDHDVYVGMRDLEEYEASKDLFDLAIWIDASERLKEEPGTSFNIPKESFDVVITNNGSLEMLERKVIRLVNCF